MLTLRHKLEIAGAVLALLVIGFIYRAWLTDHEERIKLKATLDAQGQVVSDAAKREAARDAALKYSLAQVDDLKKRTQTPPQVISALPQVLPLPQPITLQLPAAVSQADPNKDGSQPPQNAVIPAADLKPLFDFAAACKECQQKLAAAEQDKADDQVKLVAVTKERDAAVTVAKGGTKWQRIKKAAKWFGIGALAGAAAAASAKH